MFGVMDGHGLNGHHVSEFVKKNLPLALSSLINSSVGSNEMKNPRLSIVSAHRSVKKAVPSRTGINTYLPPLVKNSGGPYSST